MDVATEMVGNVVSRLSLLVFVLNGLISIGVSVSTVTVFLLLVVVLDVRWLDAFVVVEVTFAVEDIVAETFVSDLLVFILNLK